MANNKSEFIFVKDTWKWALAGIDLVDQLCEASVSLHESSVQDPSASQDSCYNLGITSSLVAKEVGVDQCPPDRSLLI